MTPDEASANAQLAAARALALRWLRETLATLPSDVTSLSIGAVLEDADDRPSLAPRLRAVVSGGWTYPQDIDGPPLGSHGALVMDCIANLDDDLREPTRPFLFAMYDNEWLTVTRADLVPPVETTAVDPIILLDRRARLGRYGR